MTKQEPITTNEQKASYKELYIQKQIAWAEVEELVVIYKKRYDENVSVEDLEASEQAGAELYVRFENLFKKYASLVKTGNINWRDPKMKKFVSLFVKNKSLKSALSRTKSGFRYRRDIHREFSFVVDTYGQLAEEDILGDLYVAFAALLKRYEQKGRTFCGYVNNAFHYYFYRQVISYTKDPISIRRNIKEFNLLTDEMIDVGNDGGIISKDEDDTYEHNLGIPDQKWIMGEECGPIFKDLTPMQRKIIVKYYLEKWSDKQIADAYCMHPNGVNQQRHRAVQEIAKSSGIGRAFIRRIRNSGIDAKLPK